MIESYVLGLLLTIALVMALLAFGGFVLLMSEIVCLSLGLDDQYIQVVFCTVLTAILLIPFLFIV